MFVGFSALVKRLIVAVGVCALAALCVPAISAGQAPTQDSVVGSGSAHGPLRAGVVDFAFDVRSGPSGEDVTGRVQATETYGVSLGGPIRIDIDEAPLSLSVVGNTAEVSIPSRCYRLVDNGPANSQLDELSFVTPSVPGDCSSPPAPFFSFSAGVISGDIAVVDAQPPAQPTSKEQCKDGGWQQYDFKNQGQCVAFVNREAPS